MRKRKDGDRMDSYRRAHPATILLNLGRVLYLILIPVLRGFITALQGGFSQWLSGAWLDILVVFFMIALAVAAWLIVGFRYDERRLWIRKGFFPVRRSCIPWENVTALSFVEPFYLRPFHAVRMRADTLGGGFGSADFTMLLTRKNALALAEGRRATTGDLPAESYHPTTGSIAALSLLTSNSFAGILFIAAFISQSGKLLGREFSEMLIGTFEEASRNLAFGIPPAAAAIGYALFAGWFISFLFTFFRYKNFALTRCNNTICINGGIFTKRDVFIRESDISFVDIRQSIATKILRLFSLHLSAPGYGRQKDDISYMILTERASAFTESRERIFSRFSPSPRIFFPPKNGFMRFVGSPLLLIAGILTALLFFLRRFPSWQSFTLFVGLMLMLPALLYLFINILDFKSGGFSSDGKYYTLRYSSGMYLHIVVIPIDKVVKIEIKQGFFQKFGGCCDLIISSMAEKRTVHHCRNLNKSALISFFYPENK